MTIYIYYILCPPSVICHSDNLNHISINSNISHLELFNYLVNYRLVNQNVVIFEHSTL